MAEPNTTPAPSAGRAAFIFILVMVAFDFLAFGIIAPVLPDLVRQFEGGDFARASSITGYFGLAWATMQFIFSPLLGAWSDRFGRRPVILISCFGLSIDYVFMALAPSLRWLFVGRLISGSTRKAFWDDQRGVWTWIRDWAGGGRLARQQEPAFSFLGRRRSESGECTLRVLCFAGIAAARGPREIRLAHGQSPGGPQAVAFACATCGTFVGGHSVLPGAQLASVDVGVLHRVSLCV